MKKVLLTGASGFIGRHCIPFLLNRGYEVFAIYQNGVPVECDNVHWLKMDLLDPIQVEDMLAQVKPTHLLHLAWYVAHGKFWASSLNLDWVKASLTLLNSFSKHGGKRVVATGTCFEYDLSHGTLSEETTPLKPATLYGSSKLALSIVLEAFAKQSELSAAWARIFFLFGPHEYPKRFIPSVIRGLLRGEPVPCTHCQQVRDFLHVEDAADALVALLDSSVEGPINISSGDGVSLRSIIENIENTLQVDGLVQFGALQPQPFEPSHLIGDAKRLQSELKWQPRWDLQKGISNAIEWWSKNLAFTQ